MMKLLWGLAIVNAVSAVANFAAGSGIVGVGNVGAALALGACIWKEYRDPILTSREE